jgi:hypothetical protein
MTNPPEDRTVIETPARQRWRLTSLGLFLTVLAALLVAFHSHDGPELIAGVVGLVFFGPITFALLVRAVRNRPVLILDTDGFTDQSSLISGGFVSWQEVQRIEDRPFRRRVFVTVKVTDPAAFRARQSAWRRLMLRINGPMVAGDILIPDSVLPMRPAELVKTMRQLQRAAQRRSHGGGASRRA